MTWDDVINRIERVVNIAVKFEAHACLMVGLGTLMCLHNHPQEGQLVIGAGLAVFKGKTS